MIFVVVISILVEKGRIFGQTPVPIIFDYILENFNDRFSNE